MIKTIALILFAVFVTNCGFKEKWDSLPVSVTIADDVDFQVMEVYNNYFGQ